MARQFNQIPPICEQAEYHMFQREKVEVQLPELFHKIGEHNLTKTDRLGKISVLCGIWTHKSEDEHRVHQSTATDIMF